MDVAQEIRWIVFETAYIGIDLREPFFHCVTSFSVCVLSLCTFLIRYLSAVARRTVNSAVVRVFCTQATACVFCVFRTSIIRAAICIRCAPILRTDFFCFSNALAQARRLGEVRQGGVCASA